MPGAVRLIKPIARTVRYSGNYGTDGPSYDAEGIDDHGPLVGRRYILRAYPLDDRLFIL